MEKDDFDEKELDQEEIAALVAEDEELEKKEQEKYEKLTRKVYSVIFENSQVEINIKNTETVNLLKAKVLEALEITDDEKNYKLRNFREISKVPTTYVVDDNTVIF